MDSLDRIYEIVKLAASQVIEARPDMDFTLDLSTFVDFNDPVAIQARQSGWLFQRQDEVAWYEKSIEYGKIRVFVEIPKENKQ